MTAEAETSPAVLRYKKEEQYCLVITSCVTLACRNMGVPSNMIHNRFHWHVPTRRRSENLKWPEMIFEIFSKLLVFPDEIHRDKHHLRWTFTSAHNRKKSNVPLKKHYIVFRAKNNVLKHAWTWKMELPEETHHKSAIKIHGRWLLHDKYTTSV